MKRGGKNSFAVRIRCRGQLVIRPRAVFLTPQPAGTWSKAALTTSDFMQCVFGGEGHFTWSGPEASLFLGITISFVVQALSPLTLHTHPSNCKEETHFLMSSLLHRVYFNGQTNDCRPKLLCRRRVLSLRSGLVFLSPPLLFSVW